MASATNEQYNVVNKVPENGFNDALTHFNNKRVIVNDADNGDDDKDMFDIEKATNELNQWKTMLAIINNIEYTETDTD